MIVWHTALDTCFNIICDIIYGITMALITYVHKFLIENSLFDIFYTSFYYITRHKEFMINKGHFQNSYVSRTESLHK